jgi:hypothetical protein
MYNFKEEMQMRDFLHVKFLPESAGNWDNTSTINSIKAAIISGGWECAIRGNGWVSGIS